MWEYIIIFDFDVEFLSTQFGFTTWLPVLRSFGTRWLRLETQDTKWLQSIPFDAEICQELARLELFYIVTIIIITYYYY